jgi:ribosomal protein L37AE/L43A
MGLAVASLILAEVVVLLAIFLPSREKRIHCPYCGRDTIQPIYDSELWFCRSCCRAFHESELWPDD